VAGERLTVEAVVPLGADPARLEPTPSDLTRIAQATCDRQWRRLEAALQTTLDEARRREDRGRLREARAAHAGPREPAADESADPAERRRRPGRRPSMHTTGSTPISVVTYVENIRDALTDADRRAPRPIAPTPMPTSTAACP